jgi:hypothetical protein
MSAVSHITAGSFCDSHLWSTILFSKSYVMNSDTNIRLPFCTGTREEKLSVTN